MNFIDKIYYFFYCAAVLKPDDPEFTPPYAKATGLFSVTLFVYVLVGLKYTGLMLFLVDINTRRDMSLALGVIILLLSSLYFSGKKEDIIKYYAQRREATKRRDSNTAVILFIISIACLLTYDFVKDTLHLPLIKL
jgi:hypothetical protein